MQIFKSKLLMVLTTLALILTFGLTISTAQDKLKINAKSYGVFTKFEPKMIDDIEGHTLTPYESKGAGTGPNGDFTFFSQGVSDLVKGNGPHHGYQKTIDKDGHGYFGKWQGKVTTEQSPEGRPIVKFGGTWSITSGTGKWENVQGGGTYKGWFIGQGIYTVITEGEYSIEK